jgi:hypothetical protein
MGIARHHPVTPTIFGGYLHVPGGVKTAWTASVPGGALRLDELDRLTISLIKLGISLGLTLLRSRLFLDYFFNSSQGN